MSFQSSLLISEDKRYDLPLKRDFPSTNQLYCNESMSFQECELAILRQAVDEAETTQGKNIANNSEVLRMISILETFFEKKTMHLLWRNSNQ